MGSFGRIKASQESNLRPQEGGGTGKKQIQESSEKTPATESHDVVNMKASAL